VKAEIRLSAHEAASAAAIQRAIDGLGSAGGRVILPAIELLLDRGLELRSGVELVGQGGQTVLRKAPGRVYPLSGYHNYGMMDAPLLFTEGLEPGMTVAIRDDRQGGFFETFARITWVENGWVGVDCGLHSDYHDDLHPVLVTAFPLIYGLEVHDVAVRGLTLDGNRGEQPEGIGGCRGAAVYFLKSRGLTVEDVQESGFLGEGLGFQMSSQVTIRDCRFANNAGNGFHPGAGSTAATFERCVGDGNDAAGFFFCVRANHITVRDCTFTNNRACGISVGTRDSFNRIERCRAEENAGPGILFRDCRRPVEVEAVQVRDCRIIANAWESGRAQVDILGDAHNLALTGNTIIGRDEPQRAGIFIAPAATHIWLNGNTIEGCSPEVIALEGALAAQAPELACGAEAAQPIHARHLPGYQETT
jgi:hypothetical protein